MGLDMTLDFKQIRDYGMLAVSNWSYLKNKSVNKEKFKNESICWVAYIAGKRESARLKEKHIPISDGNITEIKK